VTRDAGHARGEAFDFLLAGVGGQGTIRTGDILSQVGLDAGYDVKKAEVHGMSQRGGAVDSHVRWARRVCSPLVEKGRVDFLLAFERAEAARWAGWLAPDAVVLASTLAIPPLSVTAGDQEYPSFAALDAHLRSAARQVRWYDAGAAARRLGHPALAGVFLLGALSTLLPVSEGIWLDAVRRMVPDRYRDANERAFREGVERSDGIRPAAAGHGPDG